MGQPEICPPDLARGEKVSIKTVLTQALVCTYLLMAFPDDIESLSDLKQCLNEIERAILDNMPYGRLSYFKNLLRWCEGVFKYIKKQARPIKQRKSVGSELQQILVDAMDQLVELEQVADGLHFMHEYGITHGDLKGVRVVSLIKLPSDYLTYYVHSQGNVLISDNKKALLSDFGVSALQDSIKPVQATVDTTPKWGSITIQHLNQALRRGGLSENLSPILFSRLSNISCGGTYRWMAPETLTSESESGKATFSGDVFSFAMLSIEVYTEKHPHASETEYNACLKTIAGERPERPSNISDPSIQSRKKAHISKVNATYLALKVIDHLALLVITFITKLPNGHLILVLR
ncbi:hypothetical protein C0992_002477 [Termitomyces sp. T32_za158]|nr:hypothetical protein C0992_002477 [Termitomyces sp. T32_za158]